MGKPPSKLPPALDEQLHTFIAMGDDLDGDLLPSELATKWGTTVGALAKRRRLGTGPPFITISPRRVVYSKRAVKLWELSRTARSTAEARALAELRAPTPTPHQDTRGRFIRQLVPPKRSRAFRSKRESIDTS
ncbi:MAG TPA: hypothetical protein VFE60_17695 [Roseiarcus sp.]|jgi:hypothetical protein|nr:hypothetical protein [Roseiarcus sp.]